MSRGESHLLSPTTAHITRGRYPSGLRDYLVGITRWNERVSAYLGLLTDAYPPFTLD